MPLTADTVDSPLGQWRYVEWSPDERSFLNGLIQRVWYFDGRTTHRRERIFPNGVLEIIVHLDARYRVNDGRRWTVCAPTELTGLQLRPMLIEAPERPCRVLGIRLHPIGAHALLGMPLAEVAGLNLDLTDLLGDDAVRLEESCCAGSSPEATTRAAVGWAARRIAVTLARVRPGLSTAWAAREIVRRGGAVTIAEIRQQTGASKTRLTTDFRTWVGVTPKMFARVHRFSRAITALPQWNAPLSRLALDCGYYDQPHMNAEFRELSGMSPGEYIAARRYPRSASLAE